MPSGMGGHPTYLTEPGSLLQVLKEPTKSEETRS